MDDGLTLKSDNSDGKMTNDTGTAIMVYCICIKWKMGFCLPN